MIGIIRSTSYCIEHWTSHHPAPTNSILTSQGSVWF